MLMRMSARERVSTFERKGRGVEAGRRCREAQAHRGDKGKRVSRMEEKM